MMSASPLGEIGNATTAQGIAAVSADQGGVSEGSFGGGGRRQSTVVWLKLLAVSVEPFMGFMPPACASPVQGHSRRIQYSESPQSSRSMARAVAAVNRACPLSRDAGFPPEDEDGSRSTVCCFAIRAGEHLVMQATVRTPLRAKDRPS